MAGAYARTAVRLKGRGPLRLRRDLSALGVSSAAAREAIEEALAETPEETLIERAIDRRWPKTGPVDRAGLAAPASRTARVRDSAADKVMAGPAASRGHALEE